MAAFEQQLELIDAIGWNIGLEPEYGESDGVIMMAGSPEEMDCERRSCTGQYFKEAMKQGRKEAAE